MDLDIDVALYKARPWRARSCAGDVDCAARRVVDARSRDRTHFWTSASLARAGGGQPRWYCCWSRLFAERRRSRTTKPITMPNAASPPNDIPAQEPQRQRDPRL
jgi:hypothetical protein